MTQETETGNPANLAACAATRVLGGAGTGKTHYLIERACELASDNEERVLVLCATPQAAIAFKGALAAACAKHRSTPCIPSNISVTTPRSFALDVLSDAEAIRWSGREPRLLNAYEELFLMEDMKVSGLRPKRLREMLKFFYRSWTELADDDEDWLVGGEETDVHTMLKGNLAFTRSILEPEVSNLALNYLRTHPEAKASHAADHVLVDDYQLISRASQLLAGAVALKSITIAGDRAGCVKIYESYPYEAGLDEFVKTNPGAKDIELNLSHRCSGAQHAAVKLLEDDTMPHLTLNACPNAINNDVQVLANELPEDEFRAIVEEVSASISAGTPAGSIVVAVPNDIWGRTIVSTLRAANVSAHAIASRQPIRGDVRDNTRCIPARVLTALDLVANPQNALAWRCWCGYGDWLTNSSALSHLRAFAETHSKDLAETLHEIANTNQALDVNTEEHAAGVQRVVEAYKSGLTLIEQASGLTGRQLLDALTNMVTGGLEKQASAVVADLCLSCDGCDEDATSTDNSAAAIAARARARLVAPQISDSEAVVVVPYDMLAGLSPQMLIISGFVNGFIPIGDYFDTTQMPLDKQKKEHHKDVRRVYTMTSKANEQLIVSYFTSVDLETASRLKLKIDRIRLKDGKRMCTISPSEFINQLI